MRGYVRDAGGGAVDITVARDTDRYPVVGAYVSVDTIVEDLPDRPAPTGVWVAHGWDVGPYIYSIHDNELDARRAAMDRTAYAVFVEFGADFAASAGS